MQTQATAAARVPPASIPMERLDSRAEAAVRLRAEGHLEEALELLSEPGDYAQDVYTLRGDLQLELGRLHEAVGSYSTVIALDPENMYAQRNLASCLRGLERWGAAAVAFQNILDRDSYSDAARIGLGECQLHLNKPEDALACFEACWSEAALSQALFGKAVALQLLRRFDESEAQYLRFLERHPDSEEALGNLIALSMETFDLKRVERYGAQLLRDHPKSVVALQALILVAFERRSYQSAAEYYGYLLEIVPEEKLYRSGNDDALQYRLSAENIELLNQVRRELSRPARHESH